MVHLATNLLDGQGRFAEAIEEVDHAVALTRESQEATALLLTLKASLLLAHGRSAEARATLVAAAPALVSLTDEFALRKSTMYDAGVRCGVLAADTPQVAARALGHLQAHGTASEQMFLLSWYLPWLYATGRASAVHPWERSFRLHAENTGHRWRLADAASFAAAEVAIAGAPPEVADYEPPGPSNRLAGWRRRLLQLRWQLLCADPAAEATLAHAESDRRRLGAAVDDHGYIESCVEAYTNPTVPLSLPLPGDLNLWCLPSAVAGAEATTIAGTQAAAIEWARWCEQQLAWGVYTAMEWPASLLRLAGVLAARAGDQRKARRYLDQAVKWSGAHGYAIEHALARLQLAEFCAQTAATSEAQWNAMRRAAWKELTALGIPPATQAYAVSNALLVARGDLYAPRLAPRETEVLEQLARGLTYRQAAEALNLAYPTVQTLAHRAYEKLGVSGRHHALEAARELGII
jgi:DNA-binding CsgD family transcriptional regulator